jgi:hypothetical protein
VLNEVAVTLSGKEIERLGHRLRACTAPDPADIALLGELLIRYNGAMTQVADGLRSIGLAATTRLKSTGTIVDKLKRTASSNLRAIRDLAGARVVRRMTLDEQDGLVAQVKGIWPSAEVVDRRTRPSHGYRAVHVIPKVDGCKVEIQIRTIYQDVWAQTMELFGDLWGRDVRYGGPPSTPDAQYVSGLTRAEVVTSWIKYADQLHRLAEVENELAVYDARGDRDHERAVELRRVVETDLAPLQAHVQQLADVLEERRLGGTGTVTP